VESEKVKVNNEQRLYVLPCTNTKGKVTGYSCLGFEVAYNRAKRYAEWLKNPEVAPNPMNVGTLEGYEDYLRALRSVEATCVINQCRCDAELTPELIGLEGRRVEVEDCYGEVRRFKVGRSMGPIPIHLEVSREGAMGGGGVYGAPFKRVTVVR
jgi:hypothetical protein